VPCGLIVEASVQSERRTGCGGSGARWGSAS